MHLVLCNHPVGLYVAYLFGMYTGTKKCIFTSSKKKFRKAAHLRAPYFTCMACLLLTFKKKMCGLS